MNPSRQIGRILWQRSASLFRAPCPVTVCSQTPTWGVERQITHSHSPLCLQCQRRLLHSSASLSAAKAKNSKKKIVKPIRVNKKSSGTEVVAIHPNMTVEELANVLDRETDQVFEALTFVKGGEKYEEEDQVIDNMEVIKDVVKKMGARWVMESKAEKKPKENKDVVKQPPPDPECLKPRPPVVTIMGHVDHGKTTLLDALRHSNVVEQEFGGITQHIGAFSVKMPSGDTITFLDTPGHAAFSAMRARGAQVTDIIILVVAADDGVMQQTVESIEHARNAGVPLIVAINKIDKHTADIEQTKKMLLEHEVVVEELGGDVQTVPISALKGKNLEQLMEAVATQAEVMELTADPVGKVEGRVVESRTDQGRGKLATIIVQRGTLRRGCCLVAGTASAKVRGMFNDKGRPIQEAPPSTPVEVIGWKELPSAGDEILEVESEHRMNEVVDWRKSQQLEEKAEEDALVISEKRDSYQQQYQEELRQRREAGFKKAARKMKEKEEIVSHEGPQLSIIVKGDVDGSVEAILDTLDGYKSRQCRLDIVHYGVGQVTENDVLLAESFQGEIFAFNVEVPPHIAKLARTKEVPVHKNNVIYKLFDQLKLSLNQQLPMVEEVENLGEAQVLQMFEVTDGKKKVIVAGSRCTKGSLERKKLFKVIRGQDILYSGPVTSLKHFKNEVASVKKGMDCGIAIQDQEVEFTMGDTIICYQIVKVEQEIDWDPGF